MICHGFIGEEIKAVPPKVLFSMILTDVLDYYSNQFTPDEPSCCICGRQDDLQVVVIYPQIVKNVHPSLDLYFVITVCSYHYLTEFIKDIPRSFGGTSFTEVTSPKILALLDNYCATTLEGKCQLPATKSDGL